MRIIITLALLGLLGSCASTPPGRPMGDLAAEINATLTESAVVLAPGDVLSVRFLQLSDWNQEEVVVQADGLATFLSLDDMRVSGMTLAMLDEALTVEYAKILAQPELTVRTTETAPRVLTVMGEVASPGSFPIPMGRVSLLEALGLAQGHIRDTAQLDHMMLVRWLPEDNRKVSWKIDAGLEHWGSEESILLQPHDVVFVPALPVVHVNDWIDRYIRRNINIFFGAGTFWFAYLAAT
jgi:polysaccharide biosynthesis/export protein